MILTHSMNKGSQLAVSKAPVGLTCLCELGADKNRFRIIVNIIGAVQLCALRESTTPPLIVAIS